MFLLACQNVIRLMEKNESERGVRKARNEGLLFSASWLRKSSLKSNIGAVFKASNRDSCTGRRVFWKPGIVNAKVLRQEGVWKVREMGSASERLCQDTLVTLHISTQARHARLDCSLPQVSVGSPDGMPSDPPRKDGPSCEEPSQDPSSSAFLSGGRPPGGSFSSTYLVPVSARTFPCGPLHLSGTVPTIPVPH